MLPRTLGAGDLLVASSADGHVMAAVDVIQTANGLRVAAMAV